MPRVAAKKDANHNEIADALTLAGCTVFDTSQLGGGFPDLVVGRHNNDAGVFEWLLVEVKGPRGRLSPAEHEFAQGLPDDAPYLVAYEADDVLDWFGAI